jgi:cell division protein FtsI (penicillin-binding protein 3)
VTKRSTANGRIVLLAGVFVVVFGAALVRAVWLQVVNGHEYGRMAASQHQQTVTIPAARGTIFDRLGRPLAIGEQATTVFANPRHVANAQNATLALSKRLGVPPADLYERLTNTSSEFVYVARKSSPVKAAAVERLHIPGLGFYAEELRTYPQRRVAAQVLGFAGVDNKGLEGLESSLEKVLRGRPGSQTIVKDPFGRAIEIVSTRPEAPGGNVVLTIDNQVQANAETVLAETVHRWGAKAASAIVMDPATGAVLAMATAPGFDANRFALASPDRRRNRAVTDTYEPGSTFKLVTITAALSEKVVRPRTRLRLPSTIRVADRVIHESHSRGTQTMTVRRILEESSNIGTITVAERLGAGRLADWIDRFGFGRPTGIDFPGESGGLALPLDQWSGSTIGTVPIGHGIAVTPLQMASAYSAIANGGILRTPYLVDRVAGKRVEHATGHRIVTRAVSRQVMSMLRGVVLEGTGTEAAIPGYTVAGKTGTAAKVNANGRYSSSRYVASFVGAVPASKPRLVIMVMVDEPHGAIWGGVVAAPAFQEIARFNLQRLEVPPDDPSRLAHARR